MLATRRYLHLACVLLLTAPAAIAADPPADFWTVTTLRDVPYSSRHVTWATEPDGRLRFTSVTRTLYELLGQRQENIEELECLVTAELEPVSCRLTSRGLSGEVNVSGQVQDRVLVLSFERGDLKYERRLPLEGRAVFDVCLPAVLAASKDKSEPFELTIIEPASWEVGTATVTRQGYEKGLVEWKLSSDASLVSAGTWYLNDQATLEHASLAGGKLSLARATPEAAGALKHLQFSDRDLLMFTSDRDIPFPERLRSLTMNLTWTGTALDQLQLEDTRQHIVSHRQDGEKHELLLRLEQAAEIKTSPPRPVTDAAMAPYLAESRFIKPQDPTIVKQAGQWSKGTDSTLEAVTTLTRGVYDLLQGGAMIAETLSGPEVLACRKGKCSEYTTLLASLTRSVGVPSRVALGMRLVNGRWVGHMWCETWVGEWIPVDATANEVGGSPALLKITHSDTVEGTQRARFALAESLELKIADLEKPVATESDWKTGIAGRTYTNADFAARISAPGDKWSLADQSRGGVPTIRFKTSDKFEAGEPLVHFVAFSLPGPLDPAVIVGGRKGQFASRYQGFEILKDEAAEVSGDKARVFVFRQQDPRSKDKHIKTTEYVWISDKSGFLLNLIAEESVHDAVLPEFEAILKGFEHQAKP